MTFRPPWALRLWYGVLGAICAVSVGGAFLAPYFWGYALLVSVRIDGERIAKRPFGGSMRFDRVARWGRLRTTPQIRFNRQDPEEYPRTWLVLQEQSGRQLRVRLDDYADRETLYGALSDRLGPKSDDLVMGWFGRPKFTGPPPAG